MSNYLLMVKYLKEVLLTKYFIAWIILLIFSSCTRISKIPKEKNSTQLITLDIDAAFKKKKSSFLSNYVTDVKYIPLELMQSCPISQNLSLEIVDEFILIRSYQQSPPFLLLFNKENGKFIREIGKVGRGPNEYNIPALGFFNRYSNNIFTRGDASWRRIKTYNIQGKFVESFSLPVREEPSVPGKIRICNIDAFLKPDVFVNYVSNETGFINKKIIIFSKDGIISSFPNYQTWGNKKEKQYKAMAWVRDNFFYWENALFFKEALNDTIYQVTINRLIPRLIFKSQKFIPYKNQQNIIATDAQYTYYLLTKISENKDHIFFNLLFNRFQYLGIVDKSNFEVTVCEKNELQPSALLDDINGFVPLTPEFFTSSNEMICILKPSDILKWIDSFPDKVKKLDSKFNWIKDIAEYSNPVIVIAKCR